MLLLLAIQQNLPVNKLTVSVLMFDITITVVPRRNTRRGTTIFETHTLKHTIMQIHIMYAVGKLMNLTIRMHNFSLSKIVCPTSCMCILANMNVYVLQSVSSS